MSVKNEIIDLINSYQNESDFLEKLLHEQYCYYYYPMSGRLDRCG